MKRGRLIALEGVDGAAIRAAARDAQTATRAQGGVSHWDASGVFHELSAADGYASPRTLLLLYAADLAFRLRWEIGPALEEGRTVVAAPYVHTATAFGRAVGLPAAWLSNLFAFAPRATETRVIAASRQKAKAGRGADGFLGVVCERWAARCGVTRAGIIREMGQFLHQPRGRR